MGVLPPTEDRSVVAQAGMKMPYRQVECAARRLRMPRCAVMRYLLRGQPRIAAVWYAASRYAAGSGAFGQRGR